MRGEQESVNAIVGTAVKNLPGADKHYLLTEAVYDLMAGKINQTQFICIHYDWIYDNVLEFFKKKPLPIKTDPIRWAEEKVRAMSRSKKEDPGHDERELIDEWTSFLDQESSVKRENVENLKWLRAMEKYFSGIGMVSKVRDVQAIIHTHTGEVSWK